MMIDLNVDVCVCVWFVEEEEEFVEEEEEEGEERV
jgi:hypothetical protein